MLITHWMRFERRRRWRMLGKTIRRRDFTLRHYDISLSLHSIASSAQTTHGSPLPAPSKSDHGSIQPRDIQQPPRGLLAQPKMLRLHAQQARLRVVSSQLNMCTGLITTGSHIEVWNLSISQ